MGEAALGPVTLDRVGKRVGDSVVLDGGAGPAPYEVTGAVLLPEINQGGPGLGEGALVTLDAFTQVTPDTPPQVALLRLGPGADDSSGGLDELRITDELVGPALPDALYDLERVRSLPVLLAAFVALAGLATLVHSLVSLVRSRRRDLALLTTLGFTRSQVAATTAWHGAALGLVSVAVGLPLGVVAGLWGWRAVAGQLGIGAVERPGPAGGRGGAGPGRAPRRRADRRRPRLARGPHPPGHRAADRVARTGGLRVQAAATFSVR